MRPDVFFPWCQQTTGTQSGIAFKYRNMAVKSDLVIKIVVVLLALFIGCGRAEAAIEENTPSDPNTSDLFDADLEKLMEIPVVVSASRTEQPINRLAVPVSLVTAEDIHHSGLTQIPEILQFYPGVDMLRPDRNRYSIGIRGLHDIHSERMSTMVDGRVVDSAVFGGAEWSRLPVMMEDIKQIEIVRGPSGAAWGANALTGTVNIITKEPEECKGVFGSTTWNHFGESYDQVRWGDQAGPLSWRMSGGYNHHKSSEDAIDHDNFISRDFNRTSRFDNKLVYKPHDDTQLSLGGGYSNVETGDYPFNTLWRSYPDWNPSPFSSMDLKTPKNNRYEYGHGFSKLEHEFDNGNKGYVQWYGNYDKSHDQNIIKEWIAWDNTVETQLSFKPAEQHQTTIGGMVNAKHINTHSRDSLDFQFPDEPFDRYSTSLFATDRWQATERLTLEGQFRSEWYSQTSLDWAGRLAALYALDEAQNHILRLAGARAYRTPQVGLDEFKVMRMPLPVAPGQTVNFVEINVLRDEDLENERTASAELGYTARLAPWLTFNWNGYYQRFSNLIETPSLVTPDAMPGTTQKYLDNLYGADAWGQEIELAIKQKEYTLSLWYAYNDLEVDNWSSTHGRSKSPIIRAHMPAKHKTGIRGTIFLGQGWTFTTNYRYSAAQVFDSRAYLASTPEPRIAGYPIHRLDLILSKAFWDNQGEVAFGVLNVINKTDDPMHDRGSGGYVFETPGRTFFGRLQLRF